MMKLNIEYIAEDTSKQSVENVKYERWIEKGIVKQKGSRTWRYGKFSTHPFGKKWERVFLRNTKGLAGLSLDKMFMVL